MYYNIIAKPGRLEYHVSREKGRCARGESMSHALNLKYCTPESVAEKVGHWMDEVVLYKMELDRSPI